MSKNRTIVAHPDEYLRMAQALRAFLTRSEIIVKALNRSYRSE